MSKNHNQKNQGQIPRTKDEGAVAPNDLEINREKQELTTKRNELATREVELNQREQSLSDKETEIKAGLPNLVAEEMKKQKDYLNNRESSLNKREEEIYEESLKLEQNKVTIEKELAECNEGFIERISLQNNKLIKLRLEKLTEIKNEQKSLATTYQEKLQNELDKLEKSSEEQIKNQKLKFNDETKHKEEELKVKRECLTNKQAENEALEQELNFKALSLEKRNEGIDAEVESKIEDKERTFDGKVSSLQDENAKLLNIINIADESLAIYAELKQQLGGKDAEEILQKLSVYKEDNLRLKQDLLERPSTEVQKLFDDAQEQNEQLKEKNESLNNENKDLQELANESQNKEYEVQQLQSQVESLDARYEAVSATNNKLKEELKRLQPSYESDINREERLKAVNKPVFTKSLDRSNLQLNSLQGIKNDSVDKFTEIEWLDNIYISAKEYGLTFSKRILYAFHTALKTAEFSPITVLSGVSGTGKSELPRLYAHFGGINFLNVPVQPNWDSPESLLGYFNSIDNYFDAQPILNLLAQSQLKKTEAYPGMSDVVNLVLLDEMNLAHIELYFADFLSKLEERRGKLREDLPVIEVKLGANLDNHKISLGRNVLWVGTMNQDETTKSLSDKVLDRGINIHFPRPKTLESRKELKPLSNPSDLLPMKEWKKWGNIKSNLPDDLSNKYRKIVEKINEYMASVGKALGHRVWQSIEYYLSNYPLIKALEITQTESRGNKLIFKEYSDIEQLKQATHLAFEDQIVQKIMPKLRGIETSGLGKTECLDPIKQLLINKKFDIIDDFERACKFGFGQFMWTSSDYLNNETIINEGNTTNDEEITEELKELLSKNS